MKSKLAILIIAISLLLNGCIIEKVNTISNNNNYIVCSIGEMPNSLAFEDNSNNSYNTMLTNLFEGLVALDSRGNIIPAIAEQWIVSNDGLDYTFEIREEAKWSNGSSISSKDFISFFKEILSSRAKNIYAEQLFAIYGAENYFNGKSNFDSVAITSLGNKKLNIRLNEKCDDFLKILSQPIFSLRESSNSLKNWQNSYSSIKFSGAFIISGIEDSGVVLEKNQNYWNNEEVTDKKILLMNSKSKEAALASFERDKINILLNPPLSEIPRLISDNNTTVVNNDDIRAISFNFANNRSVSQREVRKKIYNAIDAEEIASEYLEEYTLDNSNIFETNAFTTNYNKDSITNAKDESKLTIKLIGINDDINKRIAKGINTQLKRELKFSVNISLVNRDQFNETVKDGDYDIVINTIKADYDKEGFIYKNFTSYSPFNYGKYRNSDIDSLVKKFVYSGDKSVKNTSIKSCENILKNDYSFIPLFHDVAVITKSKYIDEINLTTFGCIDFKDIDIK